MSSARYRFALPLLVFGAAISLVGCKRDVPTGPIVSPDWDRAAFALEVVRDEYPELSERHDLRELPGLVAVLDGARAALGPPNNRTRWLADGLAALRSTLLAHGSPRVAARSVALLLNQLAKTGVPLRRPSERPDLARGAATYVLACTPCHGPPGGPTPPEAAHLVPPPPRPTESALTPYEIFNRLTYGGFGTAMPSFAETLTDDGRWDVAFYLFADRWPACGSDRHLASLPAAELAHLSDHDLWEHFGWGTAPCLRRQFR